MKKRLKEIGILAAVFVIAVFVFSKLTNQQNADMTADIGNATLPQVDFSYNGFGVNPLIGYKEEMDITTMRDTITPVVKGRAVMEIEAYDNEISAVNYFLYTLTGEELLAEGSADTVSEEVTLTFDEALLTEERALVVELQIGEESIYYYTRVADSSECNLTECLEYVFDFHENALAKAENKGIGTAIEPSDAGDNTTFQHVTINSDYDHVTWGDLNPMVVGKERWHIVEMNETFTSVQLEYEVSCNGEENETDTYKVKEFFRVRLSAGNMYLLNYDRTMEQIFEGSKNILSEEGILLGIAPYDVPYMVNDDGTIVSFIQGDEVWNYNQNTEEISLLFSFMSAENTDTRNMTSEHEMKLLAMDEAGNTTFAVYGYMNRGVHEGRVGAAIYYYDIETNGISEVVFIPSNKSASIAKEELGKLVYYSTDKELLYILVDGALYEVDMKLDYKDTLVEGLEDGQYVVSEDGHLVAYQTEGDLYTAQGIVIKNLKSGEEYTVEVAEGETIRPLGFINEDFVAGTAKVSDQGKTISGEETLPMYKIEIRDIDGQIVKTYESETEYVLDTEIDGPMLTLHRVVKSGSTYVSTQANYIANNEEQKESNISLESYSTELKETQMRLTFADGIKSLTAKVLKPKQTLSDKASMVEFSDEKLTDRYYVYTLGELQGIYKNAGYAVQEADSLCGVVVTSDLEYVWERGNRYLVYAISGEDTLLNTIQTQLAAGSPALEVLNKVSDGKAFELTGCTTEEMLYLINKGTPVVGIVDKDTNVILTGYDETNVGYIDVASGEVKTVTYEEMDTMLAGTGRAFVGYIK